MPGRVQDAHPLLDLIAVLDLLEVGNRVKHRARPERCGPVVRVGIARVPPLPLVDQHLGRVEHIVVLRMVPVRVRHHRDVDVGRPQPALRQRLEQCAPPADGTRVYDDIAVAPDQQCAAVADRTVVRGDGLSVQQYINRWHGVSFRAPHSGSAHGSLVPSGARCRTACGGCAAGCAPSPPRPTVRRP